MSEANVSIVRRAYDAFNRGDWEAALQHADPGLTWRLHGELALDVPEAVRGREAVKELWVGFFDAWDDYKMEPLELTEAPDGRLLVTVLFTAVGQGSTAPIELTYFWLYRVRDGAITEVDAYLDRAEALAAAGMED